VRVQRHPLLQGSKKNPREEERPEGFRGKLAAGECLLGDSEKKAKEWVSLLKKDSDSIVRSVAREKAPAEEKKIPPLEKNRL